MKQIIRIALLISAVIFISACASQDRARGIRETEKPLNVDAEVTEIKGLIKQYAQSVDNADTNLAAQIWADSDGVSFIHPRRHEHGWEQVKANFYEKTMHDHFSERKLDIHDIGVHVLNDGAWVEFYWDFAAKLKGDGSALRTKGRETQVYRKTGRGWSLVHVHYSAMPVSGDRQGF